MVSLASNDLIEQYLSSSSILESLMLVIRLCIHRRWWSLLDVKSVYLLLLLSWRHSCLLQQLYDRLSELLGIPDHLLLLNVIMGKIATNLKCYTEVIAVSSLCLSCIVYVLDLFTNCRATVLEWRSYRPHIEFVLGAGYRVSFVHNCFIGGVSLGILTVLTHEFQSFLLQLHDWKNASKAGHCEVRYCKSHCKPQRTPC